MNSYKILSLLRARAVSHQIIQHTYSEAGNFRVTLTARDAAGSKNTHTIVITVFPHRVIREPRSVFVVAVVGIGVIAATAALSIDRSRC